MKMIGNTPHSWSIEYYFSVLSDWAYLGGPRFDTLAKRFDATVSFRPVKLAQLYAGSGGILLQDRARQRQKYRAIELKRWSRHLGMPIVISPKHFPTDDDLASYLIIAVQRADMDVCAITNGIMRAVWAENRDIADPDTLIKIADGHGLDGQALVEAAQEDAIAAEFVANTESALENGVFGSPFYICDGEIYWGQDRLEFLERQLSGVR